VSHKHFRNADSARYNKIWI